MKEITSQELLQLQLDILRDIDSFCRENSIEYFLVGGTGIGAVRHGGYIPWDDDIDIGMTRPHYDKFLATFNGSYGHLKVYAPEFDLNWYAPYANVCDTRTFLDEDANGHNGNEVGVKIDIFPYDAVPADREAFEKLRRRTHALTNMSLTKRIVLSKMWHISTVRFLKIAWLKIKYARRDFKSLQAEIMRLAKENTPWDEAEYLEKLVFPYRDNKPCRREIFESYQDVKFENLTVRNLTACDEFLKSVFGDYMKLPPVEQRVTHHAFKAYWKDTAPHTTQA